MGDLTPHSGHGADPLRLSFPPASRPTRAAGSVESAQTHSFPRGTKVAPSGVLDFFLFSFLFVFFPFLFHFLPLQFPSLLLPSFPLGPHFTSEPRAPASAGPHALF